MLNSFTDWMTDSLSSELPNGIVAFNLNLYEDNDSFHVQLIGASTFNEADSDWACDEIFSTEESLFSVSHTITGNTWQDGLSFIKNLLIQYLDNGEKSSILRSAQAVAIGFVDGDIEIVYRQQV